MKFVNSYPVTHKREIKTTKSHNFFFSSTGIHVLNHKNEVNDNGHMTDRNFITQGIYIVYTKYKASKSYTFLIREASKK